MKQFDLSEKVIVITGGAGLIGREFATALSQAGARVVLADINLALAERVAGEIDAGIGELVPMRLDVTDPESVKQVVDDIVRRWGRLDGWVNNAAINPQPVTDPNVAKANTFENLSLDVWQRAMGVDVTGPFLCAQRAGEQMVKQGRGVIVNISSTYGLVGPDQSIYQKPDGSTYIKPVTYSVTKCALLGLTRYLAAYWGDKNVRVNTLTLGGIYNGQDEEFVRRYSQRTPLKRMANREEVRGAIVYLMSDESSYMTGSNMVLDGGWTAW